MLRLMLKISATKRPTAKELLEFPIFKKGFRGIQVQKKDIMYVNVKPVQSSTSKNGNASFSDFLNTQSSSRI
jgi:hypothetical protein